MSDLDQQKHQINKLMDYRNEIENAMFQIERILRQYFPDEHSVAYQHWIPQIITALDNHSKWLPRGEFNMQQTITGLLDKMYNSDNKGVSKFIK